MTRWRETKRDSITKWALCTQVANKQTNKNKTSPTIALSIEVSVSIISLALPMSYMNFLKAKSLPHSFCFLFFPQSKYIWKNYLLWRWPCKYTYKSFVQTLYWQQFLLCLHVNQYLHWNTQITPSCQVLPRVPLSYFVTFLFKSSDWLLERCFYLLWSPQ